VTGATIAGLCGVVERERREGREEMVRWGKMNCRKVGASSEGNWVMRFMVEVVVGD
jgi:hypothetical protein